MRRPPARSAGALAKNDIALVYGGGGLGLMGEVARATLEAGGKVTGIIYFLTVREHMLKEVTDLVVTADMHERKRNSCSSAPTRSSRCPAASARSKNSSSR